MNSLSTPEKIQIVKWYFQGHSFKEIAENLCIVAFENRAPLSKKQVQTIVRNFEKNGCLVSPAIHKTRRRNIELVEKKEERDILICGSLENNPLQSTSQIANTFNLDRKTVRLILKKHGYKSFKLLKSHEIFPEDHYRRMEFCERVMEMSNQDSYFLKNILFTDESTFPLHGLHNSSVIRYWSRENLHKHFNFRTQYPQKLNVWAGILGDQIIGPFFIDGNLTAVKYLELLRGQIIPSLLQLGVEMGNIWYQQDGCPAHNTILVTNYLQEVFQNRIISTNGDIRWPARSPDLSPNDFFLWGYIKTKVYGFQEQRATTINDLKIKILDAFRSITPEIIGNVRRGFYDRLGYCLAQSGGRFEYFL